MSTIRLTKSQELELIKSGAIRPKTKSFGPFFKEDQLPRKKTKKQEESILQKEICSVLRAQNIAMLFRVRNGATFDTRAGIFRSNVSEKGIPDVIGHRIGDCKAVYIEVKFIRTKRGKTGKMVEVKGQISNDQKDFLSSRNESGALVGIAYNLWDAVCIIRDNPEYYPRHPRTFGFVKDKQWIKEYKEKYKELVSALAEKKKDPLFRDVLSHFIEAKL